MVLAGGSTKLALLGSVVLATGLLLQIIGLATPEWSYVQKLNDTTLVGLWNMCVDDICINYPVKTSQLDAAGAFSIIGMLAAINGLVLVIVYFVTGASGKPQIKLILLCSFTTCCFSCIFIVISLTIWAAGINKELIFWLGYSFYLCLVGAFLIAAGGIIILHSSWQICSFPT